MFDLGWTELLVIGVVALIVVGPKDLPKMFRTLGQFTAKARSMAREFTRAMEDAADQSGVKDVARDLRGMTDPKGMGLDELNKMKNWDPLKDDPKDSKPTATPPGDDEEEIDRIANEMDSMRSTAAKRAAPKPDAANTPTPDAAPVAGPESVAEADAEATSPKGSTDNTA